MWAEFIAGSLPCSERFFSGYSGFPLSKKNGSQEIFNIFFANRRITFIKFEGCFLKGQVRSNGFKILNVCVVKYLNFIVLFEKKRT